MADTNDTTPGSHAARSEGATISLIIEMADTTWRMFVPTVGFLLIGRHFDVRYHMKPWLMLGGAAFGALIAAQLIRKQLQKGRKTK